MPEDNELFAPFTRLTYYMRDGSSDPWSSTPLNVAVQGITLVQLSGETGRRFCVVSAEGDVIVLSQPQLTERIPGAGIEHADSKFHGRIDGISVIGGRLYACGGGGQFYRRSDDGVWSHLDPRFLQEPGGPVQDYAILTQIAGPSETEVYICGYRGRLIFYDGTSARYLHCPTKANLVDILVEDERTIWVCGAEGTLLRGNYRDGFSQVPGVTGRSLFQSMVMFDDKIYLAASAGNPWGLFVYDCDVLRRITTGLEPEIDDPHTVTAENGVLWAVAIKDIARFDGDRWERIDFPGNDLIR